MTITVSTDDKRSVEALVLLAGSDRWQKGHRKSDGAAFYAIPSRSQAGLFHMTSTRDCSCKDHRARGRDCAHIIAVRLKVAQLKAEEPKPAPKPAPLQPEDTFAAALSLPGETDADREQRIADELAADRRRRAAAAYDDIYGTDGDSPRCPLAGRLYA